MTTTYFDGWRNEAVLVIAGADAARKAQRTGEALFERTRAMLAAHGLLPALLNLISSMVPNSASASDVTLSPSTCTMLLRTLATISKGSPSLAHQLLQLVRRAHEWHRVRGRLAARRALLPHRFLLCAGE